MGKTAQKGKNISKEMKILAMCLCSRGGATCDLVIFPLCFLNIFIGYFYHDHELHSVAFLIFPFQTVMQTYTRVVKMPHLRVPR